MDAIKKVRRQLQEDPTADSSRTLANLVLTLENETESSFHLASLYELPLKDFELAIQLLGDWRIDRYANKKAKLFAESKKVQTGHVPAVVTAVLSNVPDMD